MAPAEEDQERALIVLQDRDRIAVGLQDQAIQRIFAAGLTLQGAASLAADPQLRRRIEQAIADLDEAVQIIRDTIFGLEHRLAGRGLRQDILNMFRRLVPAPEISFSGPVDGALPPGACTMLVDMVQEVLDLIGPHFVPTRVAISVSESSHVTAIEAVLSADGEAGGPEHVFPRLRDRAARAGIRLDIQPGADATRFAWHIPLGTPGKAGRP